MPTTSNRVERVGEEGVITIWYLVALLWRPTVCGNPVLGAHCGSPVQRTPNWVLNVDTHCEFLALETHYGFLAWRPFVGSLVEAHKLSDSTVGLDQQGLHGHWVTNGHHTSYLSFLVRHHIFKPVKGTPKKCVNSRQKMHRDKTA